MYSSGDKISIHREFFTRTETNTEITVYTSNEIRYKTHLITLTGYQTG